jgi:DNA repair photolyase
METLANAGVPVGALLAPVIPALTDQEIPALLKAVAGAGARWAYYQIVRLPHAVSQLFADWLEQHYPEKRERVLNRLRHIRGGRLNDPRFGSRMAGAGLFAEQIESLFTVARRRAGLEAKPVELSSAAFRRPAGRQLDLFGATFDGQSRFG